MKRFLLFFFIFINASFFKAQVVFCPPGAEWHYLFVSNNLSGPPDYINETIKYTGDTVIDGESVKIIKHSRIFRMVNFYMPGYSYLKQHGDTIFFRSSFTNDQWYILFNFAAIAGQSWTIPITIKNTTYTVTVDSISTDIINGFSLKKIFASYNQKNFWHYNATIIERIGGNQFFFNFFGQLLSDGDYLNEFLCYQDNNFGQVSFSQKPCNFSNLSDIWETRAFENVVKTYPNPVQNLLTMKILHSEELKVLLTDLSGREIIRAAFTGSLQLDLSEVKTGLYFLNFLSQGKVIRTEKLLKE